MDETFWKGTLSEGDVEIPQSHVDIIKTLTSRGIINSISSKNNFEDVKVKLEQVGVWDYFVFPVINWNPKGDNVRFIIESCQLRPVNVLFIDDNISNRKEVEHYNIGINTVDELFISKLLSIPELKGNDDSSHSRLKQYKILEKKESVKKTYSDNHQFLLDSEIRINIITDVDTYKDRIFELINRTNQLNYTKLRLDSVNDLSVLLNDQSLENGVVYVKDKFGDYGICGFYSLNKVQNKLIHFLFSCRILNLGIEKYVYSRLNQPKIDIIEPIAYDLSLESPIDYISFDETMYLEDSTRGKSNRTKILVMGGCDLEQMCHYLNDTEYNIIKEFNYPNKKGIAVHKEHTCYLRDMLLCTDEQKKEIQNLPFGDDKMFDSILFKDDYDVLVYSVLMNYTQEVFVKVKENFKIAYGGYKNNQYTQDRCFTEKYVSEGQQSESDFYNDLVWLKKHIHKPIIFINGSEIPDFNQNEIGACQRHTKMNLVLDKFVSENPNDCKLLDVRQYVTNKNDCTDNLRHYQRHIYVALAEKLVEIISGQKYKVSRYIVFKEKVRLLVVNIKSTIKRLFTKSKN